MKNLYKDEVLARKNEELVIKYNKQIKLNRTLWLVGSILAVAITVFLAVFGKVVKDWETRVYAIAVAIPAIISALAIVMTILIWLGNEIGIKIYKSDKILFYSGPWTNALYVNDKLAYQGSNDSKMVATLTDESICKIILKTLSFTINILPPGSDPITGLPKQEVKETKVVELKPAEVKPAMVQELNGPVKKPANKKTKTQA